MTDPIDDMTARMEALIKEVQDGLAATDAMYRAQGLDPEKVRAMLQEGYDTQWAADARKLYEADMAAVEQEIAREMERAEYAQPGWQLAMNRA